MASKIYGLYESELLATIENKEFESLVNLGSADGYYPIGMLMSSMVKHAYCFEENPLGKKYIKDNASLNKINKGIEIFGRADADFYKLLPEKIKNENNLILSDIEGGEFDLFTAEVIQAFSKSTFIIEIHDFKFDEGKQKRQTLIERFNNFNVNMILSKPKQWSDIKEITALNDNDRALICSEGRRVLGEWLIATPRI